MKNILQLSIAILFIASFSFGAQAQVTTFPWSEDFEGATFIPTGWTKEVQSGNDITQSTTQSHSTSHSARFSSYSNSSDYNQYLFSEQISVASGYTQLTFWHQKYNSNETLEWGISTTTAASSSVSTWTAVSLTTSWVQETIDLSSYIGQDIYISFHYYGNYTYYVYLDDVEISAPPTCPDPSVQTEASITTSGANLGWTDASGSHWDIYVTSSGGTAPVQGTTPTANDITSNPYTYSGGSAVTTYDWYVRSDCDQDNIGTSAWTGSSSFTTACATISSFPYTEDFENSGSIPNCWNQDAANTEDWKFSTSADYAASSDNTSGSGYQAWIDDSSPHNANPSGLVSPTINTTSLTAPLLEFYYWIGRTGADVSSLNVDVYNGTTWQTSVATFNKNNGWVKGSVTLTTYTNAALQIRFSAVEDASGYNCDVSIDDVTIKETPSCPDPTAQTESSITINSASLGWTESGTATTWDIEYGTTGFTQGAGTTVTASTSNPHAISGLTANTAYDWYVRADCGGSTSTWTGASSFTTADGKATNPTPTDGASPIAVTSKTLDWDDVTNSDGYHISVGTTSGGTDIVNNAAITGAGNSTYTVSSNWSYYTTYYWTVTTDYNSGSSVTGDVWSFTTEIGAHSFPLTEDFESGFTYFDNASGNDLDFADETTLYHGGSHSVKNAHGSSETNTLMETGKMDLSSTSSAILEFWHIAKTEGGYDKCYVEISTDGGSSYTAIPNSAYQGSASDYSSKGYFHEDSYSTWGTSTETPDNTFWKKETFSLSTYNVANVTFRFRLTSDVSTNRDGWTIDDIHIYEPSCPDPSAQTETNLTVVGADLGWTDASGSHWDVYIVATGGTAPIQGTTPTANDVTSNPYTYASGSASTTYDWYVRSDCNQDNTGTSAWAGPSTFTSSDGKAINPTPSDNAIDISISAKTLDWDDVSGATGYHITVGTTTGASDIANDVAISGGTNSTYTVASNWLFDEDYYWTVTTDFSGSSVVGDEWAFNTVDGKAVNPTPADGAGSIAVSSTILDWDDVTNATGYHISVGTTTGTTDIVNNADVGATSTYTFGSNWSNATTYYWTITTDYAGGTVTGDEWDFTTVCGVYTPSYTQDFASYVPTCWAETAGVLETTSSLSGTSSYWSVDGFANSGSTGAAKINLYGTACDEWLISPSIDLSGGSYQLEFDMALTDYGNSNAPDNANPPTSNGMGSDDTLAVVISTDNGATWSKANILRTWTSTNSISTAGERFVIDLSAYSTTVKIAFYARSSVSNEDNDLSIDNFKVRTPPACPDPSSQSTASITTTSVSLSWSENGTATTWDIEYGVTGFTQGAGTMVTGSTTNPHALASLNTGTTYDWYVRADCGGSQSTWIGPNSFTTTALVPACATSPTPADAASGVAAGTVSLSWSAPVDDATHDAATSYDVYFGTTSGALTLEGNTSNLTYDVSANTELTNYYWQIVPKNSAGSATGCSEWSFTTAVTQSATTQTAPWTENFSTHTTAGTGTTTNGWITNPTSGFSWEISTTGTTSSSSTGPAVDNTGDSHFIFTEASNGSTGDISYLYSPKLDLTALTTPELTFYYHMYGSNMGDLHIDVYNGSTYTNDIATVISGQQQSAQGDVWLKYTVNLSIYSGTIHIRFRGIRGSGYYGDMAIDDFDIHEAPSCTDPSAQSESSITATSVSLSWTENGSATTWDIEYGATGFIQSTGTMITGSTTNPHSLGSLTGITSYDWYVRADCGGGTSTWTGPHNFTTTAVTSASVSGKTSKCSPIMENRPNEGTPPSSQSSNDVFYDKFSFTVPTTGTYDILANWSYDGYLHIYETTFDPANPLTNCIGSDDDFDNGGGTNASGSKIVGLSLSSGTTYIVVGTSYGSYIVGTSTFWLEGTSAATMPANTDHFGYPYKSYTVPATDGTSRVSDYECDDASDWTTYYDDNGTSSDYTDDNLLFGAKKNGNNFGTTSVTIAGASGAAHIPSSTSFSHYTNSFNGWYVFNRYWKLTPYTQPTTDVSVRFYYTDGDFTTLNTALTNAGRNTIAAHTDMSFLKINDLSSSGYDPDPANAHFEVPNATAYDADGAWIYGNDGTASTNRWAYGTYNGAHYGETVLAHFSGGGGGAAGTDDDGSLPVDLLSFKAYAKGEINIVEWTTASELNADYFSIERTTDFNEVTEISKVQAVGNSNTVKNYSFDDNNPLSEAYYRIINVDVDGKKEVFNWVFVKRNHKEFTLVALYPNPTSTELTIQLASPINTNAIIQLCDLSGRIILEKEVEFNDGILQNTIDVSTMTSGTYLLKIRQDNNVISKLIIKK